MEKNSYLPKPDYSDVSTPSGPAASSTTTKAGFWDLFLGRLIGSCIVGCWIIGALLIFGSLIVAYLIFNGALS